MNRKILKLLPIVSFLAVTIVITVTSCKDDNESAVLKPTILNVSPTNGKAGDLITITGLGFSSTLSENVVSFNGVEATVTSAADTQLIVLVPARSGDGVVKVMTLTAEILGPSFDYLESLPIVSTWAGGISGYLDGQGINAKFYYPNDLTVDPFGNVYVADNNRIRKIISSSMVTTLAGSTIGASDGLSVDASFNFPVGVATDKIGNIYTTDRDNHRIRKITPDGLVSTLAGSVRGFADGQGINAQFDTPVAIAVDEVGNVFVSDYSCKIRKITPAGEVSTFAGSNYGFADGQGDVAKFKFPYSIAIDAAGNLFVADLLNSRIRKITPVGLVSTLAGGEAGFSDGTAAEAKFNLPTGITIDAAGNLYVADYGNHRIRKITTTGTVSTVAGSLAGYADGEGTVAQFDKPFGVGVNNFGNLFVSDRENHRIRKIVFE